jgi:PAS domain S-box-containing protein
MDAPEPRPTESGGTAVRFLYESAHAAPTDADRWIRERVRRGLALRLQGESAHAALGQAAAVALAAALLWAYLPHAALVLGALAVTTPAVLRGTVGWWTRSRNLDPLRLVPAVRLLAVAAGLAWGLAAAVAIPAVPDVTWTLLLALITGLLGGATHTLIADRWAFHGFAGGLLVPTVVGLLAHGRGRHDLVAVALLLLFGVVLRRVFLRAHAELRSNLELALAGRFGKALASRERRYLEALLVSAPVAVVALDGLGRVTGVNPAFERLFGYPSSEAVGRDINDLIVPDDERASAQELQSAVVDGAAVVREAERCDRDGRRIPVQISAAPVTGDEAGTILVLYVDLTAVRQAEAKLRATEEQYRLLVESASDLVFQTDAEGRWTFLNAAAMTIYGAPPAAFLGRCFEERVADGHRDADREAFARVLRGEVVRGHETTHRDVAGQLRVLDFSAFPVLGAGGVVVGARGIARDVTTAARVREALETARLNAERAAQAKAAFLANMSHEIRTPLNGILGMVELLLDSELTAEQRRFAELVHGSGESLLTILNDVLDYSKIEAGHVQLEEVPFDLPALVHGVATLLAPNAFGRGLELIVDVAPDVPGRVRGDAARVRQVLTNLVGNALKFTERGEVVVGVTAARDASGREEVTFAVQDTGIGIAADKLETIFGEFTQADASTSRRFGGTGLGLAISRRLVRLMGGELAVQSEPGRGSRFAFALPLPAEGPPANAAHAPDRHIAGVRVLVVDDNTTNRQVLRRFLEDAGASVEEAASAAEGLACLRGAGAEPGAGIGLAVIDGRMPDTDGFQFAEQVRRDPALSRTRMMMLSSAGMRGDAARCRDLGIHAYLTKPVARLELLEAVAAVLAGGEMPGEGLVTRHTISESRRRLRVLLAEDNPVNQVVARGLLARRGHDVTVVGDGRAAVEAVAARPFDVVLMDVQMPELDGLEATRLLRELPNGRDVPVLALTAHAMPSDRDRFLAAGMRAVVTKPFKPHELFAALEGWETRPPAEPTPAVEFAGLRASLRDAGAEDLFDTVVGTFAADAPGRMDAIQAALAEGAGDALRAAAHAYKSAAGQVGARRLRELLEGLEESGRSGDATRVPALADALRKEHARVMAALEDVLEGAVP